jgi:hypothetical protein
VQGVEANLYHTIIAEASDANLIAALLSDSPATKLLARVQRQIAAFERTWYRANAELRRARQEAQPPSIRRLRTTSTSSPPNPLLANWLRSVSPRKASQKRLPPLPTGRPSTEKTGRPAFFVG